MFLYKISFCLGFKASPHEIMFAHGLDKQTLKKSVPALISK